MTEYVGALVNAGLGTALLWAVTLLISRGGLMSLFLAICLLILSAVAFFLALESLK